MTNCFLQCVLVQSFLDFVSDVDRDVLTNAVAIANVSSAFQPDMQEQLLSVLSAYGCRQIPSPSNLSKIIADIAQFVFLVNPMSALSMIYSGIPPQHQSYWSVKSLPEYQSYWSVKSPSDLYHLYQSLTATPSKVISLLNEPYCTNQAQKTVYGYLRQYIGSMTLDQVRLFLRFVNGSSVCTVEKLEVQFNMLSGLARRPIAHTCSNILELSATYQSYSEFMKEFQQVVSDETYSWIMDAIWTETCILSNIKLILSFNMVPVINFMLCLIMILSWQPIVIEVNSFLIIITLL